MAAQNGVRVDTETATTITWTLGAGDTGNKVDVSDLEFNKATQVTGTGPVTVGRSNDGVNFVSLASQSTGTIVDAQTAVKFYNVVSATAAAVVILAARKLIIHT